MSEMEMSVAETRIRELLLELGTPDHVLGHQFIIDAVLMCLEHPGYVRKITGVLYPELAILHDSTCPRVERAIRHAIETTWRRVDWVVAARYFGNTIDPSRGKPTNGEFLARVTNIIREKMKEC